MASDEVVSGDLLEHRFLGSAMRHHIRAARMEAAPGRGVEGAGDFARHHELFPLIIGVGGKGRGKEGLGIRMQGMGT